MPVLKLTALECRDTEDDSGPDEAYIRINGRKIWQSNINDGTTKDLTGVEHTPFSDNCRIDLYDKDVGGPFDPDDHLGSQYVWERHTDRGEQRLDFSGSRWGYTLHCEVAAA